MPREFKTQLRTGQVRENTRSHQTKRPSLYSSQENFSWFRTVSEFVQVAREIFKFQLEQKNIGPSASFPSGSHHRASPVFKLQVCSVEFLQLLSSLVRFVLPERANRCEVTWLHLSGSFSYHCPKLCRKPRSDQAHCCC